MKDIKRNLVVFVSSIDRRYIYFAWIIILLRLLALGAGAPISGGGGGSPPSFYGMLGL